MSDEKKPRTVPMTRRIAGIITQLNKDAPVKCATPSTDGGREGWTVRVNLYCPNGHVRTIKTSCECDPAPSEAVRFALGNVLSMANTRRIGELAMAELCKALGINEFSTHEVIAEALLALRQPSSEGGARTDLLQAFLDGAGIQVFACCGSGLTVEGAREIGEFYKKLTAKNDATADECSRCGDAACRGVKMVTLCATCAAHPIAGAGEAGFGITTQREHLHDELDRRFPFCADLERFVATSRTHPATPVAVSVTDEMVEAAIAYDGATWKPKHTEWSEKALRDGREFYRGLLTAALAAHTQPEER